MHAGSIGGGPEVGEQPLCHRRRRARRPVDARCGRAGGVGSGRSTRRPDRLDAVSFAGRSGAQKAEAPAWARTPCRRGHGGCPCPNPSASTPCFHRLSPSPPSGRRFPHRRRRRPCLRRAGIRNRSTFRRCRRRRRRRRACRRRSRIRRRRAARHRFASRRVRLRPPSRAGQELFHYPDEAGERHAVGSDHVNEFLRSAGGADFTAKASARPRSAGRPRRWLDGTRAAPARLPRRLLMVAALAARAGSP